MGDSGLEDTRYHSPKGKVVELCGMSITKRVLMLGKSGNERVLGCGYQEGGVHFLLATVSATVREKRQPPHEKAEGTGVGRQCRLHTGQKEKELIFIDRLLCSKH